MGYLFRMKYKVAAILEVLTAKSDLVSIWVDGKMIEER
jgi:hypothetical protein